MSSSVYLASPEGESGKSTVALGLVDLLARQVGRVGIYRPVTESDERVDRVVELLLSRPGADQSYPDAVGVSYAVMHADPDAALSEIVRRFHDLAARFDVLVVLGSDYTDVSTPSELAFNARVAANLGSPVVLVVHGRGRTPGQLRMAADFALTELVAAHARPVAVIANRVAPQDLADVRARARGGHDAACGGDPGDAAAGRADGGSTAGGLRRAADQGQPGLAGPGVTGVRRRGDVAAERADPAARGRDRHRAR